MGYIAHHAIIVTGNDYKRSDILKAHAHAQENTMNPTEIMRSPINGYLTFFIPPDGSKEGWEDSLNGDTRRNEFKRFMVEQECKGFGLDWVEVRYPGDDESAYIVDEQSNRTSDDALSKWEVKT